VDSYCFIDKNEPALKQKNATRAINKITYKRWVSGVRFLEYAIQFSVVFNTDPEVGM